MKRRGEFSLAAKTRIFEQGVCAECGDGYHPEDPWHCHHIIFLSSVIARELPIWILSSPVNGELVHKSCHQSIHSQIDEPTPQDVERVLSITGKPQKMFATR